MEFRNELKFIVTEQQIALIKNRMNHLVGLDSNAGAQGSYNIRSLYFDDCYDSCMMENEIGSDPREKFRIRIYNHKDQKITLELKRKEHMMTQKRSCSISKEQCKLLMQGIPLPVSSDYPAVLQKLLLLMRTRRMEPKVIVEYDRVPYVEPLGNVRVTLDRNITSSGSIQSFLEPDIAGRPILPCGQHVLEVKYDEFLPDYIRRNLQLESLRQTAFSKYYLCRKYHL